MNKLTPLLFTAWALTSAVALAEQPVVPWLSGDHMLSAEQQPEPPRILMPGDDARDLRPRLSVSLLDGGSPLSPEGRSARAGGAFGERFFWSLETDYRPVFLQPRAHIHCQRGTMTETAYLAEECRFVDRPLPDNSVNLVQVRGQWMATPRVSVGLGVFRGESYVDPMPVMPAVSPLNWIGDPNQAEGIDLDLSVGLDAGRMGDLLMDLQVARYRDKVTGLAGLDGTWLSTDPGPWSVDDGYHHAAQLSLGWRKGDFSGGIQGHYRDHVVQAGQPPFSLSTFDIEFSWRTSWNAKLSLGASNFLRAQPPEAGAEPALVDPQESMFGRIPYVRYKQDL